MKKIILILFITIFLTGCSNDINNEIIITSMYIDKHITCLYIIPNEKDSYLASITGTGNNYIEMYNDLNNKSSQKLYFKHLTTITIDENITYDELIKFLETINIDDKVNIILANNIDQIITEYLKLAPFTTPSTTLHSKNIKNVTYKEIKQNKNAYLPMMTYQNGVIFVGYKQLQT